ncbi:MAG: hypothetical protein ACREVP_01230, partial [Burkholderiales bacterium]
TRRSICRSPRRRGARRPDRAMPGQDPKRIGLAIVGRLALGLPTQHASAAGGHDRLMLTKACDVSARLRRPVRLPIAPADDL